MSATTPMVGECGLVAGCTGSKPLAVITQEELNELGSLHDVDLFVKLSALRLGGLWCRDCHQSFIDATSAGVQQQQQQQQQPPLQSQEAGRKRDFAEISAATPHQPALPPLQSPRSQTPNRHHLQQQGQQVHQQHQQHLQQEEHQQQQQQEQYQESQQHDQQQRQLQEQLQQQPPTSDQSSAGTEQTRDLAARELAAMRDTPPDAAAAASSPPSAPAEEEPVGPRFTVTSPYTGPRETPPGPSLPALTPNENRTGGVVVGAPSDHHVMYGVPPAAESATLTPAVDDGGSKAESEEAGRATVKVSTAPVLTTPALYPRQVQEAGQQVPAVAADAAAVMSAAAAAAAATVAIEAAQQLPLPQHQPPPQLQAALQHHSASASVPPQHQLPPQQEPQHQPNQQNGGLPHHPTQHHQEAISGKATSLNPAGATSVASTGAHAENTPAPFERAHGQRRGAGGAGHAAGAAAASGRILKSRLAGPRPPELGPSAAVAAAEMVGDGVDHAHASTAGGMPIGHEFLDVDGRMLPYSLHSLYTLGVTPGALPPGIGEGPRAEDHHRQSGSGGEGDVCFFLGCGARPSYGVKGDKRPSACADHRREGLVPIKSARALRSCDFGDCREVPLFNFKGKRRARRCRAHMLEGMVDVKVPCCEYPGCSELPVFGEENEKKRRRCPQHRLPGMVDIGGRRCDTPGCKTQPTYGMRGAAKATRCAKHKEPGMMNIVHRHCAFEGCTTQPYYGLEGGEGGKKRRGGTHCAKHKLPGMVKTKGQRCSAPGCSTRPSYGHDGDRKPSMCGKHKMLGMVDVINRRCEEPGCITQPTHAFEGTTTATRCAIHQRAGMVNVKSRRCGFEGCNTQPYYGRPGDKKGSRCSKHKEKGMVDVHNRRCSFEGCQVSASFGLREAGKGATHCAKHKLPEMESLYRRKTPAAKRAANSPLGM
eukprot:g10865.t1